MSVPSAIEHTLYGAQTINSSGNARIESIRTNCVLIEVLTSQNLSFTVDSAIPRSAVSDSGVAGWYPNYAVLIQGGKPTFLNPGDSTGALGVGARVYVPVSGEAQVRAAWAGGTGTVYMSAANLDLAAMLAIIQTISAMKGGEPSSFPDASEFMVGTSLSAIYAQLVRIEAAIRARDLSADLSPVA